MPHFKIDCSEAIITMRSSVDIMQNVYDTAAATNLFDITDIKVRINPFVHFNAGQTQNDFIHIFVNIM